MNLLEAVRAEFGTALATMTPEAADYLHLVRPTQESKHGDYQANIAMALKAKLGGNPRALAEQIAAALPDRSKFSAVEIAGPGFINVRLADDFLGARLGETLADPKLGIPPLASPKTMVIDYSSPNVAKPMHVGHLRSTVIGDAIARIYRALGWKVIADNHLGDWGTQFGMLIYGWRNLRDEAAAAKDPLGELARLYREVNRRIEGDPANGIAPDKSTEEAARKETAKLHAGDKENLALWKQFMPWSMESLERVYAKLDVKFDLFQGESFFDPLMPGVVKDLEAKGIAEPSEGALCVFFPDPAGKKDKEGNLIPLLPPFLVRKSDGAFTYATSDLACIQYRVKEFAADKIVYVVDDRQSLHFQQLFATAKKWGYETPLLHVAFGKILGKDKRPLKTRDSKGNTVGLEVLLDEGVVRAAKLIDELQAETEESDRLPAAEAAQVAEAVGLGSIKYADLSQNRQSDYEFDWDKMINLKGNTAAYLQYAYARNRSIVRKSGVDIETLATAGAPMSLEHPSERTLGLALLRYPEALAAAADDCRPNVLANYLYEMSNVYSGFNRDCPVLKAPTEELKRSRLGLCELAARTLGHGLSLLGIKTVERM